MENEKLPHHSTFEYAQHMALPLAFWWILSFVCQMQAVVLPLLGFLAYGLGLFSICALARNVALFRALENATSWLRLLCLSVLTCMLCSLITTFAQHLYFRFLDGGAFLSSVMQAMEQPEFVNSWQEMQSGVTLEELKGQLSAITLGDLTMAFLWLNVLLSLFIAPFATMLSKLIRITFVHK